ncbi:LafD [Vibrio sp. 10N]|uniref:LafD n=1 Tax=Vibrio sp. 10N TaxID=3058938 RepID=UPI002813EF21|nr:hypothetical protein VB10N_01050 [Vibrio sp. 10N]
MVNTHKVSPERFRHLSQCMTVAAKTEDWQSLKRYDGQLRELLDTHRPFLKDPRLAPEIERARQAHLSAYEALSVATSKLKRKLDSCEAEKERALAYQLAMSLE